MRSTQTAFYMSKDLSYCLPAAHELLLLPMNVLIVDMLYGEVHSSTPPRAWSQVTTDCTLRNREPKPPLTRINWLCQAAGCNNSKVFSGNISESENTSLPMQSRELGGALSAGSLSVNNRSRIH